MENTTGHNYKSFIDPKIYEKKFDDIYSNIEVSLDNMQDTYFSYRINNDTRYPTNYNNLTKFSANLYELETDLNNNAENLKKNIDIINFFTKEIETKNSKLLKKIEKFKDSKLANQGELSIQNTYFYETLTQNIILGILLILYTGVFLKFGLKKKN